MLGEKVVMDIDLANKGFTIVGPRGSGKTTLAKHILSSTDLEEHLVYDPVDDYEGFRRYCPKDRDSVEELDHFIHTFVIPERPKVVIFDEANKYVRPAPSRLPSGLGDLNDLSRHWGIAWGCITRRPSQFHTHIYEFSQYIFIYGLHGRNDLRNLNDIHAGLGRQVDNLPKHHFIVVDNTEGRKISVHKPIDLSTIKYGPKKKR